VFKLKQQRIKKKADMQMTISADKIKDNV